MSRVFSEFPRITDYSSSKRAILMGANMSTTTLVILTVVSLGATGAAYVLSKVLLTLLLGE